MRGKKKKKSRIEPWKWKLYQEKTSLVITLFPRGLLNVNCSQRTGFLKHRDKFVLSSSKLSNILLFWMLRTAIQYYLWDKRCSNNPKFFTLFSLGGGHYLKVIWIVKRVRRMNPRKAIYKLSIIIQRLLRLKKKINLTTITNEMTKKKSSNKSKQGYYRLKLSLWKASIKLYLIKIKLE